MADISGTTSTTFSGTPQWYSDYLKQIAELGGSLAQQEMPMFEGPRVADWTTDQLNAFNATRDAQGLWKPGFDAAQDAFATSQLMLDPAFQVAQSGAQFDRPTYENTYWDIYKGGIENLQNVADQIGREQFQNTTLADLNRNFAGTGQFGTGRHQILGADAAATAQQKIEQAKAELYQTGRTQAMGDYLNWAKQGLAGSQQMGGLAQQQAALGGNLWDLGVGGVAAQYGDASALANIGQMQQGMNQANYNLAYQDFKDQQNYPWQQASQWVGLTQGQQLPQFNTQNSVTMSTANPAIPPYQNAFTSGVTSALAPIPGM